MQKMQNLKNMENAKCVDDENLRCLADHPSYKWPWWCSFVKTNEAFVNFGFPTPLGPPPFINLQLDNFHKYAKFLQFGYDYNGWPWTKILALV
jgi:hypothetical protein